MTDDEVRRLTRLRQEADRAYNDALTALDGAIVPKPELPRPPVGFDDHLINPLNESWRLTPDEDFDMGTGWRGWLKGFIWGVIGPIVQRQQRFNALLIDHLNRNVAGETESRVAVAAIIAAVDGHMDRLAVLQSQLIQYLQQITLYVDTKDRDEAGRVRHFVEGLSAALDDLQKQAEAMHIHEHRVAAQVSGLSAALDDLQKQAAQVSGLSHAVEIATALTHAMKREIERLHAPPPPAVTVRPQGPTPDLDAYKYVCFEDVFRGSREEIVERQRPYLQYFKGTSDVLDVGCGRGEFLELLRERDIAARGIDVNSEAVERCRERGLDATVADALGYLGTLGDESIGGLFSAQVVEHFEAEYLMRLLDVIHRTLRPGSHIVLETINPACWIAFFSAYIRDHTHRHPLHPDTLSYLLRASGFVDIEIVYSTPVPDAAKFQRVAIDATLAAQPAGAAVSALAETINHHVDRLNGLIFAEQDYAAVARRP